MSTQTIYSVRRMVCPLRLYTLFDGWFVHSDYILCSTDGLSTQTIYSVRRMVYPLRLYTLFDGWFVHSDYILCSTDGLSTQAIYSVRRMVCPLRLYTLFDGWFRRILDSHQRKFKEPNIPNLSAIQLQMPGKEFTQPSQTSCSIRVHSHSRDEDRRPCSLSRIHTIAHVPGMSHHHRDMGASPSEAVCR